MLLKMGSFSDKTKLTSKAMSRCNAPGLSITRQWCVPSRVSGYRRTEENISRPLVTVPRTDETKERKMHIAFFKGKILMYMLFPRFV